jgi:hypothetical protein
MDLDAKFWIVLWSLAAAVICTLILTIGGVTAYKSSVLHQMVAEQRADPMRASCALDIGDQRSGICQILAANRPGN